jgi:hypothetical protein
VSGDTRGARRAHPSAGVKLPGCSRPMLSRCAMGTGERLQLNAAWLREPSRRLRVSDHPAPACYKLFIMVTRLRNTLRVVWGIRGYAGKARVDSGFSSSEITGVQWLLGLQSLLLCLISRRRHGSVLWGKGYCSGHKKGGSCV